ncbi:MAG: hypothetical protein JRF63_06305 [Deltaproteobacteria bacterium]|nr:hypothetical protein [Deltaproteobacteria bacterium]
MRDSKLFAAGGTLLVAGLALLVLAPIPGCDDDDGDGLDTVGQPCESAAECYPNIDQEELSGDVVCMDEVEGGYCTHHCVTDADCCEVEGECDPAYDLDYVCGPFQSTGEMYCFISCEGEDDAYCQEWAHHDFICRSTGGGSENKKVCVP